MFNSKIFKKAKIHTPITTCLHFMHGESTKIRRPEKQS
jgi:hypothetical protein